VPPSAVLPRAAPSWRLAALFALAIAAAYANALDHGFHFDDWHVIEQNPHVRSLANLPRFFVDPNTTSVLRENKELRPLVMATLALNHAVSGDRPWSYHVLNVLLHWIAVCLVWRIVRDHLWLGSDAAPVAAAAALVVALHPLNTEPVNYVSARSALLTAVFYLAAFDAGVRRRSLASALFLVLALLSKAIAVTLPLALLAHRLIGPRDRTMPVSSRLLVVLAVLAVGGLAYRLLLLPAAALAATHRADVTPWIYFMTEWSAYLYYLRLFLWPDALVVDRLDYPYARSLLEPQAWASLLGLLAIGALALATRRRRPALAFAAAWYAVALAAESTFFPLAEPVNEHRPYLGMLGLGTAAGVAVLEGARLVARTPARLPRAFVALLGGLSALLGAATFARNRMWQDDYTLWLDATRKAPRNERAWLNAGRAAMKRGDDAEARRLLLEANRLSPCYAYVHMNLSALARRAGDVPGALRWAARAVGCNPRLALAGYYHAFALEQAGRTDEALAEYRRTTALDDQHHDAWLGQGRLLEARGEWAAAVAAYETAAAVNPTSADAAMLAGLVHHHRLGQSAVAVERFRRVLQIDPDHYGAHYQLAVALLASGRTAEARAAWRRFERLAAAIGDRTSIARAPAALRDGRP
jgi:tetratricopeptide (TPR) repeat protein